jgi:hypothetical protein
VRRLAQDLSRSPLPHSPLPRASNSAPTSTCCSIAARRASNGSMRKCRRCARPERPSRAAMRSGRRQSPHRRSIASAATTGHSTTRSPVRSRPTASDGCRSSTTPPPGRSRPRDKTTRRHARRATMRHTRQRWRLGTVQVVRSGARTQNCQPHPSRRLRSGTSLTAASSGRPPQMRRATPTCTSQRGRRLTPPIHQRA